MHKFRGVLGPLALILMAPQGEDGGGGGSGGGGGDGGEPAFTDAQRAEMTKIINGAHSAHHSRVSKTIDTKLGEFESKLGSVFDSKLDEIKGLLGGSAPGAGGGTKTKAPAGKGGDDTDDRIARLQSEHNARISEMEKKFENERNERVKTETEARTSEERTKLSAALTAAGVDAGRTRAAVAMLHTEDKRVTRDEKGKIVFKFQRDGYVDELDLEAGIEEWLGSPEGKHFAPARDVRGSGGHGGKDVKGKKSPAADRAAAKNELVGAVLRHIGGG